MLPRDLDRVGSFHASAVAIIMRLCKAVDFQGS